MCFTVFVTIKYFKRVFIFNKKINEKKRMKKKGYKKNLW